MLPAEARSLIAHPSLAVGSPRVWADLGCGDGMFTTALASELPPGSVVHAMDTNARAIGRIRSQRPDVDVVTHVGDFTQFPWPFGEIDGLLMANSLHYVRDQETFLQRCVARMRRRRLLLVEYDTDRANGWVPYPVSNASAVALATTVGLDSVIQLGRRRSAYRRELYAVLCE